MSIEKAKELITAAKDVIQDYPLCADEALNKALAELSSEPDFITEEAFDSSGNKHVSRYPKPEPTGKYDTFECPKCHRFYSEEMICPYCLDTMVYSAKAKDVIDRLRAENEKLIKEREQILQQAKIWAQEAKTQTATVNEVGSALGGMADWQAISKTVREIIAENDKQAERIKELEKYEPKPLLFHCMVGLEDFHIIVNNSVPEGQIWFASQKQIQRALEYSIEQTLKEKINKAPAVEDAQCATERNK